VSSLGEQGRPTLAVVGATGAVGSQLLRILSSRQDVWGDIKLVASQASAGRRMPVRDDLVEVEPLTAEVFDGVDVAVMVVPTDVATQWAPVAVERGAVVIDGSEAFRFDPDVPLVVPEVNSAAARNRPRGIVANPHSATLTMMDALWALHSGWELSGLVVTALQAASGAGMSGVGRLHAEAALLAGDRSVGTTPGDIRRYVASALPGDSPFPAPLAFNVVPWIGSNKADLRSEHGWSGHELAVRAETRRILDVPELPMSVTSIRVPVVSAHSIVVHATFRKRITVDQARRALIDAPSVVVLDDPENDDWPTPVDVVGSDPTFVGRLRAIPELDNAIEFLVCGDNLRKGAALNIAQIGELLAAELTGI